ncbi:MULTISPECIES: BCCT family transporter [Bacillus]|uniref:Glycine/betaine ABC transporter permease n=2 Tax=Bacillus infantis TaxID=324767 RepID=U5LFR4_9BACI|nr:MULTISPECIES: BCCT family transporter [Bacillus]OXT15658.1 glycine/betaine ABC transporter permease [Bacillus sp. OG2]AGX06674.1 glycine/betaine ABC transporter permease [Bacillus infantis NRRL B-14911]EAR63682.1 glycine betaine transporter [Bacillus sp. NRRL B-14911]MCA1033309.1 BCCT family transporter [Bacillus infantis]RYI28536.1 BCCT family transporter [Bacillus infantis]
MNEQQDKSLNSVFWVSASVILLLVLTGVFLPDIFSGAAQKAFDFTTYAFGWFYLLSVLLFVFFCLFLAISKYGRIRLGGDDERPEYSFFTWIGMLFSAGFGIGLVFWGIAEPMSHYFSPPIADMEGLTPEAARTAMGYSFFHWGVSQWSVFTIVGLAVGYFQFRKKQDGLVSTTLKPIISTKKERTGLRKFIDILAVIATVLGVATSLGLGILQINGGLNAAFGITNSAWVQIIIIVVLTALFLLSSTTGLDKGIKYLSNLNLSLALIIMLFVFIAGPTVFILNTFTQGIGDYITNFINWSLRLTPYKGGTWVRDWTIFYWAWAIAWSPFVGAFIARVSRGRTIREFVVGVLIIPPLIALLWTAVFGGTALHFDLFQGTSIAEAVNADVTSALFTTYGELPFTFIVSLLSILLIFTFLITSADSATYILGSMTSKGSLMPPLGVRIVWGILIGAIAAVLLLSSGLEGLQTASLVAALPFTVILVFMCISLLKSLSKEPPAPRTKK